MSESTRFAGSKDDDGIVVLTLDDPNQSANTMNAAYAASMEATVDRLEAEKDQITGVVITSAKKTFFAGGDLHDLRQGHQGPGRRRSPSSCARARRQLRRLETLGKPVVAAINGAALGGGLEICLACHHRIALDDPKVQLGFPEVQLGLLPGAGGVVRTVRMLGHRQRAAVAAAAGPAPSPRQGQGARDRRRARRDARGARARGQGVDQGQPRCVRAAVGRRGLQDPRRHAVQPQARAEPAGVPGQPAQAAQGRQLPRSAPHHGRGRRGRPGRLRQRDRDRGPLLRRPGDRPGGQEHDPGVLLRHAARQRRSRPSRRDRDVRPEEGRRARRRDDGRGDRVRVREGRARGRAQGRHARSPPGTASSTRRSWSRRPSRGVAPPRSRRRRCSTGSRRPPTRRTPQGPSW